MVSCYCYTASCTETSCPRVFIIFRVTFMFEHSRIHHLSTSLMYICKCEHIRQSSTHGPSKNQRQDNNIHGHSEMHVKENLLLLFNINSPSILLCLTYYRHLV